MFTHVGEEETPESVGKRMVSGGFLICQDSDIRHPRAMVVNMLDVEAIIFEDWETEGEKSDV